MKATPPRGGNTSPTRSTARPGHSRPACVAATRRQRLLALGVVPELTEVDHHAWLVTDNLGIVSWWNREDVTGPDLAVRAILHLDSHAPRQHVAQVRDLAGIGAGDRLHVLRPSPPGLEGALANCLAGNLHDLGLTIALERSGLVWRVEVLDLYVGHSRLLPCPR